MKHQLLAAFGALLTSAGLALAQTPTPALVGEPIALPAVKAAPPALPAAPPAGPTAWPLPSAGPSGGCNFCAPGCGAPAGPRFWASGEYLMWWLKGAPLGGPIATTGSTADPVPGALGQPHTQVISPNTLNDGMFSGGRLTAGGWLDQDGTWGIEGTGFLLQTRSASFAVASPPGGRLLFVPFLDMSALPPAETALPFGDVGATNGAIAAVNSTRLWGSEGNVLLNLENNTSFTLTALGGFRYLDLTDNLHIDLLGNDPSGVVTSVDQFSTRNQFWGGQVGARGEARCGDFFVNLSAKVALGDMHESVSSNGFATFSSSGVSTTVPGGFFVQNSNAGRRTSDVFAVVPEAKFQVGYDATKWARVFVGYEFLYASDVVRAGDQIDHRINFSQQAPPLGNGSLVGPAFPLPQFNHTDFWAHGISFGVLLRF